MLDFIDRDVFNFDHYVQVIHNEYSNHLPIQAGYSAVALLLSDYIDKCSSGYLQNNRVLSIKQYKGLLTKYLRGVSNAYLWKYKCKYYEFWNRS